MESPFRLFLDHGFLNWGLSEKVLQGFLKGFFVMLTMYTTIFSFYPRLYCFRAYSFRHPIIFSHDLGIFFKSLLAIHLLLHLENIFAQFYHWTSILFSLLRFRILACFILFDLHLYHGFFIDPRSLSNNYYVSIEFFLLLTYDLACFFVSPVQDIFYPMLFSIFPLASYFFSVYSSSLV